MTAEVRKKFEDLRAAVEHEPANFKARVIDPEWAETLDSEKDEVQKQVDDLLGKINAGRHEKYLQNVWFAAREFIRAYEGEE